MRDRCVILGGGVLKLKGVEGGGGVHLSPLIDLLFNNLYKYWLHMGQVRNGFSVLWVLGWKEEKNLE